MKILDRYYDKIYKQTDKLLKAVFNLDVISSMKKFCEIKNFIEKKIDKPISEISVDDLISHKLSYVYCEYKTLNEILSVLSGASFLKAYREEEMEEIKNEYK